MQVLLNLESKVMAEYESLQQKHHKYQGLNFRIICMCRRNLRGDFQYLNNIIPILILCQNANRLHDFLHNNFLCVRVLTVFQDPLLASKRKLITQEWHKSPPVRYTETIYFNLNDATTIRMSGKCHNLSIES